jgi:hypothetical protein
MKRDSLQLQKPRASAPPPYFLALPSIRPFLPALSTTLVATYFPGKKLPYASRPTLRSVACSRHTPTPLLPSIEYP